MKRWPHPWAVVSGALFLLCLWGFIEIAEDYPEGRYHRFDEAVLRALRATADPAVPRGPSWLLTAMRDLSALGGNVVLTLGVVGLAGYLVLRGRRWDALSIVLASSGGALLNLGLKALAARPRPQVVPHLTEVTSSSFPSVHSMLAAIIYLSAGALIARSAKEKGVAAFAIGGAALLAFLVGCTRVYLGVHFPSDVLAGWIAGAAWTLLCVAVHTGIERRPAPPSTAEKR